MTMAEKLKKHPFGPWSLALYGMTGSGKSSQAARVARHLHAFGKLKTRWYLFDDGDTPAEADAGIREGFIDVVDCRAVPHPFLGAFKLARGLVPVLSGGYDEKHDRLLGQWQVQSLDDVGLVVIDSVTGYADDMFTDLSAKSALGINVGGDGAMNFKDGSAEWGEVMVGSSNRGHYLQVQNRIQEMISRLKQLAAKECVMTLCTFGEDRGETESTRVSFIGPKTKGGAQTTTLPGWFKQCYRMVTLPSAANTDPKRILWTERHKEGGVDALANRRFPVLAATSPLLKMYPPMLDPADVVRALSNYQAVVKACGEGGA